MTIRTRAAALCGVLSLITLAACSSNGGDSKTSAPEGYNAALQGVVNASQQTGGTLKVGTSASCDNFDPGTTYGGSCWFLQRLLSRNLVSFGRTGEGASAGNGNKLQADLAESLGQANTNKTVWTYKLRDGLKFSNGAPLTSADVKYGFERMYATDVITGGPQGYYLCLLDKCDKEGTPTYKGPFKDPSGGLSSIATPDAKTIVFTLTKPFGDWDYLMALPAAAPVPQKSDKGSQYGAGTNLVSSGPYILKTVKPKQSVLLARNPEWTRTADPIRSALPDSISITVLSNADDLDTRLKTGALDVSLDGGVQTTFQSQILNDQALKARADNPVLKSISMLILYPSDPVLTDVHCRRAVAYALDKRDIVIQFGGTNGADFASHADAARLGWSRRQGQPVPVRPGLDRRSGEGEVGAGRVRQAGRLQYGDGLLELRHRPGRVRQRAELAEAGRHHRDPEAAGCVDVLQHDEYAERRQGSADRHRPDGLDPRLPERQRLPDPAGRPAAATPVRRPRRTSSAWTSRPSTR